MASTNQCLNIVRLESNFDIDQASWAPMLKVDHEATVETRMDSCRLPYKQARDSETGLLY